jgi:hypothetical protein
MSQQDLAGNVWQQGLAAAGCSRAKQEQRQQELCSSGWASKHSHDVSSQPDAAAPLVDMTRME